MEEKVYTLKLVVIGDYGVGKSSLITRYVHNTFDSDYISTIGVDFLINEVRVEKYDAKVQFVIWDIGGQEEWKSKINLYLNGTDGGIVVCDLTRPITAKNIALWVGYLEKYTKNVPYIVVGNKSDLDKKVSLEKLKKLASGHSIFIASAKTGKEVEELFKDIALEIIEHKEKLNLM